MAKRDPLSGAIDAIIADAREDFAAFYRASTRYTDAIANYVYPSERSIEREYFEEESAYYDDATEKGGWDDIDYFDYDELDDEEFLDEEADSYGDEAK